MAIWQLINVNPLPSLSMSTTPEASPAPSTPDQNGDQSMSKTIEWNPESWRNLIAKQQPIYTDQAKLDDVLGRLATLPPLVTSWEIENLK
ncbi:3-deoxy-7-phosphoheptulonate synthase, partial [bacterium]|nr:3-deoxy-7-phosphoheptulonate synthase [bacterium]